MKICLSRSIGLAGMMLAGLAVAAAQQTAPAGDSLPKGQVLFQSHGEPPVADSDRTVLAATNTAVAGPEIADRERAALSFTAYDLDARLSPTSSRLAMRARVTVRNEGAEPLARVALQISSTLQWESVALIAGDEHRSLVFAQHSIDTDADHTGKANEAVVTLLKPLLPGAGVTLDVFYSGTIAQDSQRLKHLGAAAAQADAADWDAIGAQATNLRGFGNVLWYPVAAPQLFLGDGAKLFQAIGHAKLSGAKTTVHLRVAVEYRGEPPVAAYFCGRRRTLTAISDDAAAPTAAGSGIASAEFAVEPIGFRTLSLMVVSRPEVALETDVLPPILSVESEDDSVARRLGLAAELPRAMFDDWLGARPLSVLTVIDHAGQPFEDGPMLVAPADSLALSTATDALVHSLSHAWIQTGQPWMDEGLAQFFALQWTERSQGRPAALAQLKELLQPLAIAELGFATPADVLKSPPGQPLIAATDEMFYRRKAAAVWWMLNDLAGNEALRLTLQSWRTQPVSHDAPEKQTAEFEALLEKTSGKDLAWFFHDWVLHDLGLPDLTITDVTPRALPAGNGHGSSWLVAVTVRNDGAAAADVPLIIRSGSFSTTRRLRLSGFASVTERVVVESAPTEVVLNDGDTPEIRTSVHSRTITIRTE